MKDDADMSRLLRSFMQDPMSYFTNSITALRPANLIKTYFAPYCSQL